MIQLVKLFLFSFVPIAVWRIKISSPEVSATYVRKVSVKRDAKTNNIMDKHRRAEDGDILNRRRPIRTDYE